MLQNSQNNQEIMETSALIDKHFDEIMTYLNQPASTPISHQAQEFHQCYQVNQLHIPQESTPHIDSNFESYSHHFT